MAMKDNDQSPTGEKRIRKSIQRLSDIYDRDFALNNDRKVLSPVGEGLKLADIERVKDAFNRSKIDKDMAKNIHIICYKTSGQAQKIYSDIRKFNGFQKDESEVKKRIAICDKINVDLLRVICDLFNIPTSNKVKKEVSILLVDFLQHPIETGSKIFRTNAFKPKKKNNVNSKYLNNSTNSGSEIDIGNVDIADLENAQKNVKIKKENTNILSSNNSKKNIIPNIPKDLNVLDGLNIADVRNEKYSNNMMDFCEEIPDEVFINLIQEIILASDANTTTLNQVCDAVVKKFPEVDLISRRHHIKLLIKKVIKDN